MAILLMFERGGGCPFPGGECQVPVIVEGIAMQNRRKPLLFHEDGMVTRWNTRFR